MPKSLRLSTLILFVVLVLSCTHGPKVNNSEKIKPPAALSPLNLNPDDIVSFISGMANNKSECLGRLDSMSGWIRYSRELDSMFLHAGSFRFAKMKIWADSELDKGKVKRILFYPFSGPDFLNADIFYPDADQYILIGMEPVGYLPDICSMPPDTVSRYLNTIKNSLNDIFKRSYFITSKMNIDLSKTKVNGTVPLISLFIRRTGHQIISLQRIGVDPEGKLQFIDSFSGKKKFVYGIKIDFHSASDEKVRSVFYFRTDLSDKGLTKNKGFRAYLSGLTQSNTFLKSASYLLHSDNFKIIRSLIFDLSSTILQDDSGIAYKDFNKSEWDIKLYGRYLKPRDEFSYIKEPDLEKAYKSAMVRPLPYSVGYNWGRNHSNLLYAVKK